MRRTVVVTFLILAILAIFMAGCTQPQPPVLTPQPTVPPTTAATTDTVRAGSTSLGTVMTDANGMTLYFFTNDIPSSGTSACTGAQSCSTTWPAFSADTIVISSSLLDKGDFSSITRADGTKQTTWYGWPLYHYSGDKRPGDVNGDNLFNKWYVLKLPEYSVMLRSTPALGTFLTDTSGKTLYFFARENPGEVACTGSCLKNWPAFSPDSIVAPSILKAADFAGTTRPDGVRQSLYMGRLLYSYAGDTKPGDTNGEGVLDAWHVANITGYVKPVPTVTATTPPTTKPTIDYGSNSDGGGDGGGGGGGY